MAIQWPPADKLLGGYDQAKWKQRREIVSEVKLEDDAGKLNWWSKITS